MLVLWGLAWVRSWCPSGGIHYPVLKNGSLTHHHSGSTEYFLSRAIAGFSNWHLAGGLQELPGVT